MTKVHARRRFSHFRELAPEFPRLRPIRQKAKAVAIEINPLRPGSLEPAELIQQFVSRLQTAVKAIREWMFPAKKKVLIPVIGENSRAILDVLEKKGTQNLITLKQCTGLSDKMLCISVGWLAREGKIRFKMNKRQILVSLPR